MKLLIQFTPFLSPTIIYLMFIWTVPAIKANDEVTANLYYNLENDNHECEEYSETLLTTNTGKHKSWCKKGTRNFKGNVELDKNSPHAIHTSHIPLTGMLKLKALRCVPKNGDGELQSHERFYIIPYLNVIYKLLPYDTYAENWTEEKLIANKRIDQPGLSIKKRMC